MSGNQRPTVLDSRARTFDVICAGEALLNVEDDATAQPAQRLNVRPGGGVINAAIALAAQSLHVGLATVLTDDTTGRALRASIAARGVDISGVERATRSSGLVLVKGGARQVVSFREEEQPISVPENWSSQVLFLSGMSPVVAHGAALCKAARAARRAGSLVVVDLNARWSQWQGRDSRIIRMVLREADVVWCSAHDLFGLNLDLPTLRAALRPTAVLVSSDGAAHASATGPFGEVFHTQTASTPLGPFVEGDAFTVAICSELARAGQTHESSSALWARVLQRAHAIVLDRARR